MSKARIEDGMLVISVSINALSHAARYCPYFDFCRETGGGVKITDEAAFAESVRRCVVVEEGDPMLEDAIRAAGIPVEGKAEMFRFGELNVNRVRKLLANDLTPEAQPPAKTSW